MKKNMDYTGNGGIGLTQQGIQEPIILEKRQRYKGLGYGSHKNVTPFTEDTSNNEVVASPWYNPSVTLTSNNCLCI